MNAIETIRFQRTPWGFDSRWLRVEAFDANGDSLGIVTFEPSPDAQSVEASSGVWAQISRMSASLRSMVRRLKPSAAANSVLS